MLKNTLVIPESGSRRRWLSQFHQFSLSIDTSVVQFSQIYVQ